MPGRSPLQPAKARGRSLRWLSRALKLAGMDGSRTHPGRLNSAPQTVLKTAELMSTDVHYRPPTIERQPLQSTYVRHRPLLSIGLAVILAVWRLAVNRSLRPLQKRGGEFAECP